MRLCLLLAASLCGCAGRWVIPLRHPPSPGTPTEPSGLSSLRVRVDPFTDQRDDHGALKGNAVGHQAELSGDRPVFMHQNVPFFVGDILANVLRSHGLRLAEKGAPCDTSVSGNLTHYWVDSRRIPPAATRAVAWVEADLLVRTCARGEPLLRRHYSGTASQSWDAAASSSGEARKRLGRLLDEATLALFAELASDPDFIEALRPFGQRL